MLEGGILVIVLLQIYKRIF